MSKQRIVYVHDDSDIINRLVKWKAPFVMEITGSTRTIISDRTNTKYICTEKRLGFSTLGFIRQVKTYASGLDIKQSPFSAKDIDYYRFSDLLPGVYTDVIEVDVKAAYWSIAYQKGYISEEIYNKAEQVNKMDRLIALGSLATVRNVYRFDGQKVYGFAPTVNEKTRSYFFDVARELDLLMKSVFKQLEYAILWYWVDAFFLRKDAQGHVYSQFYKHGLDCSVKHIDKIEVEAKKRSKVITCYMPEGEEKTFHVKPISGLEKSVNYYNKLALDIRADIERIRESGEPDLLNFKS